MTHTDCNGVLWMCEAHPDSPWPHDAPSGEQVSKADGKTCPGPGMPCSCNPDGVVEWDEVYETVTFDLAETT